MVELLINNRSNTFYFEIFSQIHDILLLKGAPIPLQCSKIGTKFQKMFIFGQKENNVCNKKLFHILQE